MRTALMWIAAAFVFGSFYTMVAQKEALLRNGQTVYLSLAPRDPRSFMQGDYMALNYDVSNELYRSQLDNADSKEPRSGVIVIQLDSQNVGKFARYYHGGALAPGEHLLKYHHASGWPVIGAESYFIPENSGADFSHAVYGELKVEADGTPLIVALCDKDLHPLTAPADSPPAH